MNFAHELTKRSNSVIEKNREEFKKIKENEKQENFKKALQEVKEEEDKAKKYANEAKKLIEKQADKGEKHHHIMQVLAGIGSPTIFDKLVQREFENMGLKVLIGVVKGSAEGSGNENDYTYMTVYWK